MLRAFLIMHALGYYSITKWVNDSKTEPILAILSGFDLNENIPGIGTYYDFIDRLMKIDKLNLKKSVKNTKIINVLSEKQKKASEKDGGKRPKEGKTRKIVEELELNVSNMRLSGFYYNLEQLLYLCGVKNSVDFGFIKDLKKLKISSDTSVINSFNKSSGKRVCKCLESGNHRCLCKRIYRDPLAKWGYDANKKDHFYGYKLVQNILYTGKYDLPLNINIVSGNSNDGIEGIKNFDRLLKILNENNLAYLIYAFMADSAYDCSAIYEYLMSRNIKGVIDLNNRGLSIDDRGIKFDEKGIPFCKGNLRMKYHGYNKTKNRYYFHCPAKSRTSKSYKHEVEKCPLGALCQSETKLGPFVSVYPNNYRKYPGILRSSEEFQELYNQRTSTERSNSNKKYHYDIHRTRCRSWFVLLFRTTILSILEHSKSWQKEFYRKYNLTKSRLFDDFIKEDSEIFDMKSLFTFYCSESK